MSPLPPKKGRPSTFAISISFLQSLLPKPTVPKSIQPEYIFIITAHPISKPKTRSIRQKKTFTSNAKRILIEEFDIKKAVLVSFSPTLTDQLSQNAIDNFQAHINRVAADAKDICLSYGLFISSQTSQFVH